MEMNDTLILKKITHVYYTKRGDRRSIFNNVNLSIKKGETVTILGKSGYGKTTLANIICGYLEPTNGNVFVNGLNTNSPSKERVMVNQSDDLFDWMSIEENMKIATKDVAKINRYLIAVNLINLKNEYPHKLSGGMRKKLSLARALAANPSILVLDEPFSYLDHSTKSELFLFLSKNLKKAKTTTILITHDIDEAIYLSDRIFVLSNTGGGTLKEFLFKKNRLKSKTLVEEIKSLY